MPTISFLNSSTFCINIPLVLVGVSFSPIIYEIWRVQFIKE